MTKYNKDPIALDELFEDVEDDKNPNKRYFYPDIVEKAKKGDIQSIYEIAETWTSLEQYDPALQWYRIAADKNYAPAEHSLGYLYCCGYGVARDYHLGIEWYLEAAKQNYKYSIYRMGVMFEQGWGVPEDQHRANEWYYKNSVTPIPEEEQKNLQNINTTNDSNPEGGLDNKSIASGQDDSGEDEGSNYNQYQYEEEDYHLTDREKEKTVQELISEAELILTIEKLKSANVKATSEIQDLKETNIKMQKEINLADGRIQLLKTENQIMSTDMEKQKAETTRRIEALEKSVEQFTTVLLNKKPELEDKQA